MDDFCLRSKLLRRQKEEEIYEHWSEGLLTKDGYKRQLEKLALERSEADAKLENLENSSNDQVEEKAKMLLELSVEWCKS